LYLAEIYSLLKDEESKFPLLNCVMEIEGCLNLMAPEIGMGRTCSELYHPSLPVIFD
jgi:hypothetical protein